MATSFPLKKMAIDFLVALPDTTEAQLFAKDKLNSENPGAQTFIVSHPKRIYRMSIYALIEGKPLSLYEWMGNSMKKKDMTVKNTIDMDMEGVPKTRPFNEDIVWVVSFVSAAIENHYKVIVARDQWVVLKCDFDDVKQKYSAHLILHGFVWPDVKARKRFMESIGLVQEFAKRCPEANSPHRIIDASVFDSKMLRLFKSTKLGKNLPLWGATVDGCMPPEESFDYFRKSMGSYTANCRLLEEPVEAIPVAVPAARPIASSSRGTLSTPSFARALTSAADKDRYAPPFPVLERLVLALDQNKRVGKGSHENWIRLGWAITNIGRAGGYEQAAKTLFDDISKPHTKAYDDAVLDRLVDNARTDSNRVGWPYLKKCLLEDDPDKYKEIFDTSIRVNMDIASSSQVATANGTQVEDVAIVNYVDGSKTIIELVNFCATFNEMKTQLEGVLGFRNVCLLQEREAGFNFDADKNCKCPLCTVSSHDGNAYYCIQVMPRVFVVRNYASGCKQHIVGWEEHGPLEKLLLTPDSDAPYVDLFEAHFKRRLKWTGKHFLFFRDHLWRPIPTEEVYNTISKMANLILDRLLQSLAQQKKELDVQDNADKDSKKETKERYQAALKGMKYIKRNSNVRGMVEMTKNRLIADVDNVLDTNPYLLGTENGILDLKTGLLRVGVPEDNISKSVGYCFFDDSNQHEQVVQDAFDEFLGRIYPVDEEREVVQRFCGYALLGSHPEKKMCLFTDARGGYNGKSSMCKALMGALGSSYAHKPKPELLYKPDFSSGTIDSHSSGMLNFRGVRLAIVEELDEKKQLNNALIKDLNGGNSTFEGRACKSAETVAFPWITKMVLAFNNQRMPNFDFTDPALLNRFLIIQHRSRFCTEEDDYETNKDVPYTFIANSDLDQLLVEWRPYMLKWCLKGLENYFSLGFRRFPPSCEEWKKAFVAQRDLVAAYVGDFLEKTGDQSVCLTRAELYSTYSKNTPEEQKSKTQLGKGRFFEALKKTFRRDRSTTSTQQSPGLLRRLEIQVGWK